MTALAATAIELRGVRQRFGEVLALANVDFTVNRHERLGIVGPSGCGKSTLLSEIAGLIQPDEGTVTIDEATTAEGAPQAVRAHAAARPPAPLADRHRQRRDRAAEPGHEERAGHGSRRGRCSSGSGSREFEERMPAELSGGMRQRVAFLRTLMAEKDVLLLDEPFAALDSITRSGMQEWLLSALEQEPRTVLLVTHDVDEALLLTHRVVVMSARPGRIVRTLETDLPRDRPRREVVTSPRVRGLEGVRARGAGAMNERAPTSRRRRAGRTCVASSIATARRRSWW